MTMDEFMMGSKIENGDTPDADISSMFYKYDKNDNKVLEKDEFMAMRNDDDKPDGGEKRKCPYYAKSGGCTNGQNMTKYHKKTF
jgi:hypothetical protein